MELNGTGRAGLGWVRWRGKSDGLKNRFAFEIKITQNNWVFWVFWVGLFKKHTK